MKFDIGFISADTHTPDYLMHKYWARKPHNVISECIRKLTPDNGIVLDPFCGSGVTLREGAILGRTCYGYDVNPAAVLITSVLIDPPLKNEFIEIFTSIYNKIYSKYGFLYLTENGKNIKYISHKIITKCSCGEVVKQNEAIKNGKKLLCPKCNSILRYNLESMYDTEIFGVTIENDKKLLVDENELINQKRLSEYTDRDIDYSIYDFKFPANRRILAFDGIRTSSFFTKRNFTILCAFADEIWKIQDEKIRNCSLLLLNASVAQCSRLIAHRNNLSTGGPAWSVPGFWIPQEHLETNPFVHIKARLNKIIKGIDYINMKPRKASATVVMGDSLKLLSETDVKADLIFLDPPYGDSVPYTEFSNIWNSFLKKIPSSDDDISVSDRIDKNESWRKYSQKLDQFMKCFSQHITKNGKLLITFNNNDMKAWKALISALQDNHFVCKSVFYQIPAVISSKAQMSIKSSYISDIYSVFMYEKDTIPSDDLLSLKEYLIYITNAREGVISKTVLDREFIITWLKKNINHNLLEEKDKIINELFIYSKNDNIYLLKKEHIKKVELLKKRVIKQVNRIVNNGSISLLDCYRQVCKECLEFGTLELSEFKLFATDYIDESQQKIVSIKPTLFDL
ncbi:MAG: DNA methyltransferase [Bacteroidales bacterium]|nr:DNA methyltransferase [Bacteroidales bacterium]